MATVLSLSIRIQDTDSVVSLDCSPHDTVAALLRRINQSYVNVPNVEEYGLLVKQGSDGTQDRWLHPKQRLGTCRLRHGDLVEFAKRVRPLNVRLLDGTQKRVMIDDSQVLGEVVSMVCQKLGIKNSEEFSLIVDDDSAKKADKKPSKDAKSPDDVSWLAHDQTLREQGITASQPMLLRKKFFFSDQNVDRSDAVQINILYQESKDAILDGTHPCTLDEAAEFAAMQVQVEYGDHNPDRHKPGFIDNLRSVLPAEYVKTKGSEKKIYVEHKKLAGKTELNIKYRYVQLCRSLKTYGVTFFSVKEKVKGKNKMVGRLLGITRESVMRVDEKTKEVLKTWPLTTVRRWAAAPASFTLDFGDYSESYYSVQTPEGEAISQLLAGYIDIVLKKKKRADKQAQQAQLAREGTVASPKVSRITRVASARQSQAAKGAVAQSGSVAAVSQAKPASPQRQGFAVPGGSMRAQQGQIRPAKNAAQTAVLKHIQEAQAALQAADRKLDSAATLPQLGTDQASLQWRENMLGVSQQNCAAHLAAITAACSSLVTLTQSPHGKAININFIALGSSVTTLSSNFEKLADNSRMIAALGSAGPQMLAAGHSLAQALGNILKPLIPAVSGSHNKSELLATVAAVGASATGLMDVLRNGGGDVGPQNLIHDLSKAVAATTSDLISAAKAVAGKVPEPGLQDSVISSAKDAALATSELVHCTKVLTPTISNPLCQEQLVSCARTVAGAVEGVVNASQAACPDQAALQQLGAAATAVTGSLGTLLQRLGDGSLMGSVVGNKHSDTCAAILMAAEKLNRASGDAPEMVRQAKLLAQATSKLVGLIKEDAQRETDPEAQQRHLLSARALAAATSKMVAAAKEAARSPNSSEAQAALQRAAEELRDSTNAAAFGGLRKQVLARLEVTATQCASVIVQLASATHGASGRNRNPSAQQQLEAACHAVAEHVSNLVASLKGYTRQREDARCQLELINKSREVLQPGQKTVAMAKAAAPTVDDPSVAMQLSSFAKACGGSLVELKAAIEKASEVLGASLEMDSATAMMSELLMQLAETEKAAAMGTLVPLPGQTINQCVRELGSSFQAVSSAIAQVLTAAEQGSEKYVGSSARDASAALQAIAGAVRGVAATTEDITVRNELVASSRALYQAAGQFLSCARQSVSAVGDQSKAKVLNQSAANISQALRGLLDCLPGHKEMDQAIAQVNATPTQPGPPQAAPAAEYQQRQQALSAAAGQLSEASREWAGLVVNGTPSTLAQAAARVASAHEGLMQAAFSVAEVTSEAEANAHLLDVLQHLPQGAASVLSAGKEMSTNPSHQLLKGQLSDAVRNLTGSINALIDACATAAPGQKECDNAVRTIKANVSRLQDPTIPVSDASYFDTLDTVMAHSKVLGGAMAGIAKQARTESFSEFAQSVNTTCSTVVGLIDAAAQAAYLIGIADPTSEAGESGVIDIELCDRAERGVRDACETLVDPSSQRDDILAAATVVAKHTSGLCNACKAASAHTTNPVAKKQFIASAGDVASCTSSLVSAIKTLAQKQTSKTRAACADTIEPLQAAVAKLTAFAASPEFASSSAIISEAAREHQKPVVNAAMGMGDSSCGLIQTAKALAVNSKNASAWQQLATYSKAVSDSIKTLVSTLRDHAPGQAECDCAIFELNKSISELDAAQMAATMGHLEPHEANSFQGFQQDFVDSTTVFGDSVEGIAKAALGEPQKLSHGVMALANRFGTYCAAAIGAASRLPDKDKQESFIEQAKTVAESALQLVYAARDSGGNAKAVQAHGAVLEAASDMKDAVRDVLDTTSTLAAEAGIVTGLLSRIADSAGSIQTRPDSGENVTFVEFQQNMVPCTKQVSKCAQDIMVKAFAAPSELGGLSQKITKAFAELATLARGAVAAAEDEALARAIHETVVDLGDACSDMVQGGSIVQANPDDAVAKKELSNACRAVMENVNYVLSALQSGSKGTQACINAAEAVESAVVDLETTSMFAAAGSLNADIAERFVDHRDAILDGAKALVSGTKQLVSAAGSSQDKLALAAESSLLTFSELTDQVKMGASALSSEDNQGQVLLLNAARDVAAAFAELLSSTRLASGKSLKDPAMDGLKTHAKVMVSTISSLLKTVKSVDDESLRGVRAIESAVEAINSNLASLSLNEAPDGAPASAQDVLRSTRPVTSATSKVVFAMASGKAEDITAAANLSRKAVDDLATTCKSAAFAADSEETRMQTLSVATTCCASIKQLLERAAGCAGKPADSKAKEAALQLSRAVAASLSDVTQTARALAGQATLGEEDPNAVAERELLQAAGSIEAAARKLAEMNPMPKFEAVSEDLPFEEQIVRAAKSIAMATATLVKSASAAQRELVAQGRATENPEVYNEDVQWSQGLVSAAQQVAAATSALCEAANATVEDDGTTQRLVASAKAVAKSTAQLLVACKVRADLQESTSMKRLQSAGNAVKRAADVLINAAKQNMPADDANVDLSDKYVRGIAQEIEAAESFFQQEQALERAKRQLLKLRAAKYKRTSVHWGGQI
eukprot:m.142076 g.142076  ORF g.142076 m.142076 type:complete len:2525 (-) comp17132_c0_seq1:108-7682(-)